MKLPEHIRNRIRELSSIRGNIDKHAADKIIRSNVYFRGPTVWILAFSIVIASVGLNVNSTAVIIGAMLISPLMGPIIGIGLATGTNDIDLFRDSAWNLLIMVGISLLASTLYFMLSPLSLANPTELEARTTPSIFDVLIALFGGAAGILELTRKEKGTVLSGVAIATALMPPLCTAGYGLSRLNMHFFLGAMGLFLINTVFIAFASFVGVKLMGFKDKAYLDAGRQVRMRRIILCILLAVMIPSLLTAFQIVKRNNFEIDARAYVVASRSLSKAYIYDHKIDSRKRSVEIHYAGDPLTDSQKEMLMIRASEYGIPVKNLKIGNISLKDVDLGERISSMHEREEARFATQEAEIMMLRSSLDSLRKMVENITPSVQDTL